MKQTDAPLSRKGEGLADRKAGFSPVEGRDAERLQPHRDRFDAALEDLIASMDDSDRCVVGKAHGIGVIKLRNGRRAEIQLRVTTEKEEWIKGK